MLMLLQVDDTGDNERLVNDAGGGGGRDKKETREILRWRSSNSPATSVD